MNKVFSICHTAFFVLLIISVIDMALCSIAYINKRAAEARMKDLRKMVMVGSFLYLLVNIGYYLLGIVLITKGDLTMRSSELILQIASKMHWASIGFIIAALVVTVVTIIAAKTEKGNVQELKKLLGNCIVTAIVFWILAWLIV